MVAFRRTITPRIPRKLVLEISWLLLNLEAYEYLERLTLPVILQILLLYFIHYQFLPYSIAISSHFPPGNVASSKKVYS
jgi:hypothetical protein